MKSPFYPKSNAISVRIWPNYDLRYAVHIFSEFKEGKPLYNPKKYFFYASTSAFLSRISKIKRCVVVLKLSTNSIGHKYYDVKTGLAGPLKIKVNNLHREHFT